MTTLRTVRDAVKTVWDANWPHGATYPVIWHRNENPTLPVSGDALHWIHIIVDFDADEIRAFGGGRLANDRAILGSVVVRVFTQAGYGEDTALDLLDAAISAFRSRRDGDLSFIGTITGVDDGGTEDGAWYIRGALIGFEYRYQG